MRGMACTGDYVAFGSFGLKALEAGWITSRQIESARITISRRVRKVGRMWIRIFPDKSITKKPAETRMGKGKGSPEYWVAVVKPGRILFEIEGLDEKEAEEAFKLCSKIEGIIPALEPSHALAYLIKKAPKMPKNNIVVMNMCGRGDKDIFTVAKKLKINI